MSSDKDIKSWDQRLMDQVKLDWHNYEVISIDLSIARNNEPILVSGEYIYCLCEGGEVVNAQPRIRLNRNTNDELPLRMHTQIETVFNSIFFSNDAVAEAYLIFVTGINFKYINRPLGVAQVPV